MKFSTPRNILFGRGSIKEIENFVKGKGVVVTGENVWESVSHLLPGEYEVIFVRRKKWREPAQGDVDSLSQELLSVKPETIIAIGGGSVIDSAKAAWIFYENPEMGWKSAYSGKIPPLRKKARFIAVETTSGTGTGVSAAAVITDEEGKKRGLVSESLIPDVAIYDPELVMSMPENAAIYSGLDALGHAVEAYTSNVDNVVGDTLALKAIQIIYENIEKSVNGDESAREMMHYGNMLAGMGFTNSRLHLGHAAAHVLGARYKLEHGKAVGMILPYMTKLLEDLPRFRELSRIFGEEPSRAFLKLNRRLGMPSRLAMEESEIDSLAEEIFRDRLMRFAPRELRKEDIVKMLYALKEGDIDEI